MVRATGTESRDGGRPRGRSRPGRPLASSCRQGHGKWRRPPSGNNSGSVLSGFRSQVTVRPGGSITASPGSGNTSSREQDQVEGVMWEEQQPRADLLTFPYCRLSPVESSRNSWGRGQAGGRPGQRLAQGGNYRHMCPPCSLHVLPLCPSHVCCPCPPPPPPMSHLLASQALTLQSEVKLRRHMNQQ